LIETAVSLTENLPSKSISRLRHVVRIAEWKLGVLHDTTGTLSSAHLLHCFLCRFFVSNCSSTFWGPVEAHSWYSNMSPRLNIVHLFLNNKVEVERVFPKDESYNNLKKM
jgi:hypothetical protein